VCELDKLTGVCVNKFSLVLIMLIPRVSLSES
jgi:hypothetical protein